MAAPTSLKLTKLGTEPVSHALDDACRRVRMFSMGAGMTVSGDSAGEKLNMREGRPLVLADRNLAGSTLDFTGSFTSISIFEELGSGA